MIIKITTTDYEEIEEYKKELELSWAQPAKDEIILKFEQNGVTVAFMSVMISFLSNDTIWINDFEVLKQHRCIGIGRECIRNFLSEFNATKFNSIELDAKDKKAQAFWEKCGFEDNGITDEGIPLIYYRHKQ